MELLLDNYTRFVYGTNECEFGRFLARWYEENSKIKIDCVEYACIGIYSSVPLKGVIIYNNYTPTNLDIHVWMPNCFSKIVLREMFDYPFNRANVIRLTAKVASSNKNIVKILKKLGFKLEASLVNYCSEGVDRLIYVAKKENIEKWV